MRQNYTFIKGVMDKDIDTRLVEKGKFIDMENAVSYDGKVFKPKGMEDLGVMMPFGYECIGGLKKDNYIYYFGRSSSNAGIIGRYDVDLDVNETILNAGWLNFTTRILSIDYLEDASNNRIFLYWTDGANPPCRINVVDALSDPFFFSGLKDILNIAPPPEREPQIAMINSEKLTSNNIRNKVFSFSHRYIYTTGEKSPLSFFSRPGFYPPLYFLDTKPKSSITMFNSFNGIRVFLDAPSVNGVESIEVFAKEANSDLVYRIKSIETDGSPSYTFDFYNDGIYPVLSDNESQQLYDSVPLKANAQELIENVLIYGDYTEGYTNDITPDFDVSIIPYSNAPGSVIVSASSEALTNVRFSFASIGVIYRGDVFQFTFKTELVSNTSVKRVISFNIVAEEDYADIGDWFADSKYDLSAIFYSYGISASVLASEIQLDLVDTDYQYELVGGVATAFVYVLSVHNHLSLKPGETYKYAIQYYDEYNRQGGLIESDEVINPSLSLEPNPARVAKVEINHSPPEWAKKFKILRKEINYSYERFNPEKAKFYDSKIWVKVKDDDAQLLSDTAKYIELVSYTVFDFPTPIYSIEATDSSHPIGESGRWIVIKDSGVDGYSLGDTEVVASANYANSVFNVFTIEDNTDDTYKEIPGTYDVVNGFHISSGLTTGFTPEPRNQTGGQSFIDYLIYDGDIFVGYATSTQTLLYKVDVGKNYSALGRSIIFSENFRQQNRESSVIYSDVYVEDSGDNGLSSFNLTTVNYKDYDRIYGAVKKIYARDTDLVIFQEDKVLSQPFRKDLLLTVGGDPNVSSSDQVLGTHIAYVGEFGMSHPESFAFRDNTLYWADAKRGEIIRLDVNGLYPISENGAGDSFHEFFKANQNPTMRGAFDVLYYEYLLLRDTEVWAYSRKENGWTRRLAYVPDCFIYDGIDVFSFKGLNLYKHYTGAINNHYGTIVDSSVTFAANDGFSDKKVAHAIYLEGDEWPCTITDTNGDSTSIDDYEDKEGYKYAGIPMIETSEQAGAIGGIGDAGSVSQGGGITTFDVPVIPSGLSIGDTIETAFGPIGTLASIANNTLTITGVGAVSPGDFVFYKKNAKIEGAPIRDHVFEIKLTSEGSADDKLFAVDLEVSKSNV